MFINIANKERVILLNKLHLILFDILLRNYEDLP